MTLLVAVDPGHPSYPGDTGAVVPGLVESEYTWEAAHSLQIHMRECVPGVEVRLLRASKDEVVSLPERGRRSAEMGADLVMSLHVDSSESDALRHASGYYWPSNLAGYEVSTAIVRAMPHPLNRRSGQGVFPAREGPRDQWLARARAVMQVHRATSVLIELGYCSHPEDLAALLDSTTQTGIMLALMAGIVRFQQLTTGGSYA